MFFTLLVLLGGLMLLYISRGGPRPQPVPALGFGSTHDEYLPPPMTSTVRAKSEIPVAVAQPQADVTTVEESATVVEPAEESDDASPDPGESVSPLAIKETVYHDGAKIVAKKSLDEVPGWVTEAGDEKPAPELREFVLSSQRFATVEEARHDLMPQLTSRIQDEMRRQHPQMSGNWRPALETAIDAGAVMRECEVTWPLTVGGFTEPVYRVHWQVDLNDEAMGQFYAMARPHIVVDRLQTLAFTVGASTLLMGAGVLVLRRRESRKVA